MLCAQSATSRTLTHCSGHARLARPRESPWPMVATSTELTQELAKAIPVVKLWKFCSKITPGGFKNDINFKSRKVSEFTLHAQHIPELFRRVIIYSPLRCCR